MKKDGKGILYILIGTVLVLAIAVAGVFAMKGRAVRKYREWISLGQQYLSEQNYEQAILAFTEAITIAPKSAAANGWLGDAYVGQAGSYDSADVEQIRLAYDNAAAAYTQAITLAPDNDALYVALTDTYTANAGNVADTDPEAAEEYLRQAEDLIGTLPEDPEDTLRTDLTDRIDKTREEIGTPASPDDTEAAEGDGAGEDENGLSPENAKAHEAYEERMQQLHDLLDAGVTGKADFATIMQENPDTPYLLWMMFNWDPNMVETIRLLGNYRDLNGDGIDELIVATLEKSSIPSPIAIYAFDGTGTRMIFDSGERYYFSIDDDGTVISGGSNGATSGTYSRYRIGDDGFTTEEIERWDYEYTEENGFTVNGEPTEEEAFWEWFQAETPSVLDGDETYFSIYPDDGKNYTMENARAGVAYSEIIGQCYEVIWEGITNVYEVYPELPPFGLGSDNWKMGYAIADLNLDGVDEMVIGVMDDPKMPIIAVYTFDGTAAHNLLKDNPTSFADTVWYLGADNTILGYFTMKMGVYRIADDGYSLEELEYYDSEIQDEKRYEEKWNSFNNLPRYEGLPYIEFQSNPADMQ